MTNATADTIEIIRKCETTEDFMHYASYFSDVLIGLLVAVCSRPNGEALLNEALEIFCEDARKKFHTINDYAGSQGVNLLA